MSELRTAVDDVLVRCVAGQRIPAERDLAAELKVGRALVRHVLRDLEHEGRIVIRAQSGSYLMEERR